MVPLRSSLPSRGRWHLQQRPVSPDVLVSIGRLRGGGPEGGAESECLDLVTQVPITFLRRNVSELQSYLPYLQEYQNPMVARAWPANTNFVSISETVTDTVFRNSLRAESKGLVYRQDPYFFPRIHAPSVGKATLSQLRCRSPP